MEISRDNKLETIADLNKTFAEKLGIEGLDTSMSREDILKMIQRNDEECFSVLAAFNNAWLAWDYVRGDKELKIKVEDVWKLEMERHKEAFMESKEAMLKLAAEKEVDLEPLMLQINWL